MRNLARIVVIDAISPIKGADAIEVAHVGGWKVVVRKDEFKPCDMGAYFEIDTFLPEGNPAWQFLVDKSFRDFNGMRGHVLRSVKLRGQISQGLLLGMSALKGTRFEGVSTLAVGLPLEQELGVLKYEPPIPECLIGLVRGMFPSRVPKTDQERIQNLANELPYWQGKAMSWEVSEKLEGESGTFAWLEDELHVCTRTLDILPEADYAHWKVARELDIQHKFETHLRGRNIALQGEVIGFGIEGNSYGLKSQVFCLYDVYDVDQGRYLRSAERQEIARLLDIPHVPIVNPAFVLDERATMEELLTMADGASALKPSQTREGLVFKALTEEVSFKAISNKYLLKQKD